MPVGTLVSLPACSLPPACRAAACARAIPQPLAACIPRIPTKQRCRRAHLGRSKRTAPYSCHRYRALPTRAVFNVITSRAWPACNSLPAAICLGLPRACYDCCQHRSTTPLTAIVCNINAMRCAAYTPLFSPALSSSAATVAVCRTTPLLLPRLLPTATNAP